MQRRAHISSHRHQRGAVIMLMLLVLVLGAASFLLTELTEGDARQPGNLVATAELGAIAAALVGYATVNGRCLPCPDTGGDGQADAPCGAGTPVAGSLPWVTLGLGAIDAWGNRLRYVVDPDFTGSGACVITQSLQSDIVVQGRDAAGALYPLLPAAGNPPAVVIAHGANGYGAVNENGAPLAPPPAGHSDEETNRTAVSAVVQRPASNDAAAPGGPFDDLIDWVDMAEYKAQLVKADSGTPLPP